MSAGAPNPPEADVASPLEDAFGDGTRVEHVSRLTGGASRETWAFDAVHPDGRRQHLIYRRDRAGGLGASSDTERRLLEAAAAGGVAVPRVEFSTADGYVMQRVEGETIPRKILRDPRFASARPVMARQAGELAARIHALPLAGLPDLPGFDGFDHPAQAQVHQYRALLDAFGEPHPVFELSLRWLAEHVPPGGGAALVHGDFRNGNFVVGTDGIRAVLDWELAHLGDPMEDLGWLCVRSWRFREVAKPVGGFGERADLFAGYEAVSGKAVDPEIVRYWEVFGTLKWGEMCMVQAFTHLNGLHRSVELAAIGRRVCETEWHLLDMIG